jgi:hypothetical protein
MMHTQSGALAAPAPTLCLTDDELTQLTGKVRPSAQIKALRYMAIDHKRRPDGSIVVLRNQLGDPCTESATTMKAALLGGQRTEPNWN